MLSIITPFKVFRFSRSWLDEAFGLISTNSFMTGGYAACVELEAAERGEVYSPHVITSGFFVHPTLVDGEQTAISFECSDGSIEFSGIKSALSRHSLLIRGFFDDYPDATTISVTNHTKDDVSAVIYTLLGMESAVLTPSRVYTLQTFSPATDLYYFSFVLPQSFPADTLLSILKNVTDVERNNIVRVFELSQFNERECSPLGSLTTRMLPQGGRGLDICYTFSTVYKYLLEASVPEIDSLYPSAAFLSIITSCNRGNRAAWNKLNMLLKCDFQDDCGCLHSESIILLLLRMMTLSDWKGACTILGMFGVRHPRLKNEDVTRYAPYQVTLRDTKMTPRQWNQRIYVNIRYMCGLNESDLLQIVRPYLREEGLE